MRKRSLPFHIQRSFLFGLLVSLFLPVAAFAGDIDYLLEEGRVLLEEDVDFNAALVVFMSVVEDDRANEAQRFEARRQAAFCLVALDRMDEAHTMMVEMLMTRPDYQLPPYTSPKMSEAMAAARAEAEQRLKEERREMAGAVREPAADQTASWARDSSPRASQRSPSLLPYYAAAGGGALVALGVGSVNGLAAKRAEDRLLNEKDSFSSHDEALEFRETAVAQARRANWLFATSAILAVTAGTVLYLDRTPDTGLAMTESGGLLVVTTRTWD